VSLVLADRVKETSTTTGTGTYTLAGAVTGFESFGSIGNGNTTYYACTLGSDFEVGIGTYTSSGTTLARTTILQSSNSDNAVNWGAGTKTLFCTQPAEKAVFRDASGNVSVSGTITGTGTSVFTNLDISGDVDVDGTLEADAMTLNGTSITSTATLSTGISNNNVPKFTSGVADNDFLRVDGTAIEGRSASEVLSDIGAQASLTFGISNTNAVKIDSSSVADNEFARFTANGLESRSTSEVLSDIGAITASSTDTLTNKTINASQLSGTIADARLSSAVLTTSNSDAPSTTTSSSDADFVLIDDGGTMKKITPANLGVPANKDFGLVTGSVTGTEDFGSVA
jgi:hypothetical protein